VALTSVDDLGFALLRVFAEGLRGGGTPAGGFKQRLSNLPARMERGGWSFSCQQQPAGLQPRARPHALDHVGAGQRHDAAAFLAAGRNHRLARFEPDAAVTVAKPGRISRQVAIWDILSEPLPQFVVGDRQHLDLSRASSSECFIKRTPARCKTGPPLYQMRYFVFPTQHGRLE